MQHVWQPKEKYLGYIKLVGSAPSRYSFNIFGWYSRISRYMSSRISSFVILRLSNSNSILLTGCAEGSLSTLAKPLKYGSAKAYQFSKKICPVRPRHNRKSELEMHENSTSSALGRSLGSNASILSNKRRASGSALGNFWEKGTGFFFRMLLKYLLAFSFRICMYTITVLLKININRF